MNSAHRNIYSGFVSKGTSGVITPKPLKKSPEPSPHVHMLKEKRRISTALLQLNGHNRNFKNMDPNKLKTQPYYNHTGAQVLQNKPQIYTLGHPRNTRRITFKSSNTHTTELNHVEQDQPSITGVEDVSLHRTATLSQEPTKSNTQQNQIGSSIEEEILKILPSNNQQTWVSPPVSPIPQHDITDCLVQSYSPSIEEGEIIERGEKEPIPYKTPLSTPVEKDLQSPITPESPKSPKSPKSPTAAWAFAQFNYFDFPTKDQNNLKNCLENTVRAERTKVDLHAHLINGGPPAQPPQLSQPFLPPVAPAPSSKWSPQANKIAHSLMSEVAKRVQEIAKDMASEQEIQDRMDTDDEYIPVVTSPPKSIPNLWTNAPFPRSPKKALSRTLMSETKKLDATRRALQKSQKYAAIGDPYAGYEYESEGSSTGVVDTKRVLIGKVGRPTHSFTAPWILRSAPTSAFDRNGDSFRL